LDHDAEEGGTEFALPPTINMPVNEIYWKRRKEKQIREPLRNQQKGVERINRFPVYPSQSADGNL
jgi:hypothetical protein